MSMAPGMRLRQASQDDPTAAADAGGRRRRTTGLLVAATVLISLLLLVPGAAYGPGGTVAVRRFLTSTGLPARDGEHPPAEGGTFLLLVDRRTDAQEEELLRWVREGGRLVVADPLSALVARYAGVRRPLGAFGTDHLRPGCAAPESIGVSDIEVQATDGILQPVDASVLPCFAGDAEGREAYELVIREGEGEVVLLGGWSFLNDELLDHADNAVFTREILDGGGPVVFGSPLPPRAQGPSLWETLPAPARAIALQIVVAAALFVLVRGRRFGRPVPEDPLSPIPAGELVQAEAALFRRARTPGHAGGLLRRWTRGRLGRTLGVPPGAPEEQLQEATARATGMEIDRVRRALDGPEPVSDDELIELARELESIARRLEGAGR